MPFLPLPVLLVALTMGAPEGRGASLEPGVPRGDAVPRTRSDSVPPLSPKALQRVEPVDEPWETGDGLRARFGSFSVRLRTRLHFDWVSPELDTLGAATGETLRQADRFRRVRFMFNGDIGKHWDYRTQVELSDTRARWLDAWANRRGTGLGQVKLGHFREPLGLEAHASATHVAFIERADPAQAFTPGRSRGVMLWDDHGAGIWQLGAFRGADGRPWPDELDTDRALTGRVTWITEDALDARERLTQFGIGASVRDPGDDGARLRARPGTQLLPRLADTGSVAAERLLLTNAEALWIDGPLSLQAEVSMAELDLDAGPDATLFGGYLQASAFLGEGRRGFRPKVGAPGPAKVANALAGQGPVVPELALRWSRIDLTDGAVDGGVQDLWSVGLNLYMAKASRIMVAWHHVELDDMDGELVTVRLQLEL